MDFSLGVSFGLSRKEAPFGINIALLVGGGWIESTSLYHPSSGALSTSVSIGIDVGAHFGITLGPIAGEVGFSLGLGVEFFAETGRSSSMAIILVFILEGSVSALGFIDIYLRLMLELRYENGGLSGSGSLSVSIKICWCFTFEFSTSFTQKFDPPTTPAGPSVLGGRFFSNMGVLLEHAGDDPSDPAVDQYLDLLYPDLAYGGSLQS